MRLLPILLLLNAALTLYGQREDFCSWFELDINKGFNNSFDLSAEIEQRFNQNSSRYNRSLVTVAAEYSPVEFMDVNAGFRVLTVADQEMRIAPQYRIHGDVKGRYKLGDLALSIRFRMQYGFEEFLYFAEVSDNLLINRNRLKAAYHIFGSGIRLFTSAESWGLFQSGNGRFFKQMRYTAGVSYTVNFHSELSVRYILEDEFNQVDPLRSHILVIGYSHTL